MKIFLPQKIGGNEQGVNYGRETINKLTFGNGRAKMKGRVWICREKYEKSGREEKKIGEKM